MCIVLFCFPPTRIHTLIDDLGAGDDPPMFSSANPPMSSDADTLIDDLGAGKAHRWKATAPAARCSPTLFYRETPERQKANAPRWQQVVNRRCRSGVRLLHSFQLSNPNRALHDTLHAFHFLEESVIINPHATFRNQRVCFRAKGANTRRLQQEVKLAQVLVHNEVLLGHLFWCGVKCAHLAEQDMIVNAVLAAR